MPSTSRSANSIAKPVATPVNKVAPGPDEVAESVDPNNVIAVDQPAGDHLKTGVGPEESGEKPSELRRIEMQLVFQSNPCHRQVSAVDVIDGDRDDQQSQRHPFHARDTSNGPGRRHGRGHEAPSLAPSALPVPPRCRGFSQSCGTLSVSEGRLPAIIAAASQEPRFPKLLSSGNAPEESRPRRQ